MAAQNYSVIEMGSHPEAPRSAWRVGAMAMAAGAAATFLLTSLVPQQSTQYYTVASGTAAATAVNVPVAQMVRTSTINGQQVPVPVQYSQPMASGEGFVEESQQSKAPVLLAASGILFLVAAAMRYFKPSDVSEYQMLALSSVQDERRRRLQEEERAVMERRQRLAREEAARRSGMGMTVQPAAAPKAAPQPVVADGDWARRQQERERQEKAKAEAAKREIQERLARLARLSSGAPVEVAAPAPVAAAAAPVGGDDWSRRQNQRELAEKQKAEAAKREIQERMARLARLSGAPEPAAAPAAAAPVMDGDWARRQQERERREQEKAEAAKREIQERLARLARLSSGAPAPAPAAAPSAASDEFERLRMQREERERKEREVIERAQREVQERLQRLQKLTAGSKY